MSYIDNNLLKDEKVIIKAKISIWVVVPKVLLTILGYIIWAILQKELPEFGEYIVKIKIAYIFLALFFIGYQVLVILTTHLVLTNKRLIGKYGILSVKTMDIKIEKLDNISYSAKFFGMLFHYYRMTIKSASGVYNFNAISNAQLFKNTVTQAIEEHEIGLQETQAKAIAEAINKQ